LSAVQPGRTSSPGKMAGRKATMDDLFAEPEDADSNKPANAVTEKMKKLDSMNARSRRVVIEKTATQGEFGAKKFIKP